MQDIVNESNPLNSAKSSRHVKSHTNHAFEVMRESIVSGELRPNQRLVESSIAKKLGMSRTPVREALLQLGLNRYFKSQAKNAK